MALGGGWGTLIFSYIRRLRTFWGVQIFEFQYFWGAEKLIILMYEDFVDILWGHRKIGLVGSFLCILGSSRYRMGILRGDKILNIILGCLVLLIFF